LPTCCTSNSRCRGRTYIGLLTGTIREQQQTTN